MRCSPGNTADNTTVKAFLRASSASTARRDAPGLWVAAYPPREVLQQMRASDPAVQYLVGRPEGRLTYLSGRSRESRG